MDLNSGTKYKTVHKGQVIYKEGQKSSVAYMLKKGRVTLYRVLNNKKVVLAQMVPGQVFGEEGLLSGDERIASAMAEEPSELIILDRDTFQGMLLKCPGPVQRLMRYLVEQMRTVNAKVAESATGNVFLSVCGVLDLMYRAAMNAPKSGQDAPGVSYAEFSRTCKDILLVTQLEIDEVVERLRKLKVVDVTDVKEAVMKADALGRKRKTTDFLRDRYIAVDDVSKFMAVARNINAEMSTAAPFTQCLEYIDIFDLAEMADTTPEMLYKKMSYNEVPEKLMLFHRETTRQWVKEMGPEFFKRVKRKRVKVEDLESVDDIVFVDNTTLQEVFSQLGFNKVAILSAIAGEEARERIMANLSKKMSTVVREQAAALENLDDMEAADAEDELLDGIKRIKGLKQ